MSPRSNDSRTVASVAPGQRTPIDQWPLATSWAWRAPNHSATSSGVRRSRVASCRLTMRAARSCSTGIAAVMRQP